MGTLSAWSAGAKVSPMQWPRWRSRPPGWLILVTLAAVFLGADALKRRSDQFRRRAEEHRAMQRAARGMLELFEAELVASRHIAESGDAALLRDASPRYRTESATKE